MEVKIGLVEFPGPVATLLLNQKRKRARPQVIYTEALIRQPSEAYSQTKNCILEAILILNIFFRN